MAVFYIILAIGVVALNADKVPHVFEMIFVGAFNPSAFTWPCGWKHVYDYETWCFQRYLLK